MKNAIGMIWALGLVLTFVPMLNGGWYVLFEGKKHASDYYPIMYWVIAWWVFLLVPCILIARKEKKYMKKLNLPKNFKATWKQKYTLGHTKYFAISPTTNQIAFYDTGAKVARVETVEFVKDWDASTTESHTGKVKNCLLRIYFDDYEYPYIELKLYGTGALKKFKQFEMAMRGTIDKSSFHPSKIMPEYFPPAENGSTSAARS